MQHFQICSILQRKTYGYIPVVCRVILIGVSSGQEKNRGKCRALQIVRREVQHFSLNVLELTVLSVDRNAPGMTHRLHEERVEKQTF